MRILFTLLACFFSLFFLFGCSQTDDPVIAPGSPVESIGARASRGPLFDPEVYPDWWIRLTDEEVAELLKVELPHVWRVDLPQEKQEIYTHAHYLQTFGDIPEVRLVIEFGINLKGKRMTVLPKELTIAGLKAHYLLWPNEANKRALEETLRNLPPEPDPDDKRNGDLDDE